MRAAGLSIMPSPRPSTELLREAVQRRVNESSLREVADEIGMSFSALGSFLRGETSPNRRTLALLIDWYYDQVRGLSTIPREDVNFAIALLRTYIGESKKPKAVSERRRREIHEDIDERPD